MGRKREAIFMGVGILAGLTLSGPVSAAVDYLQAKPSSQAVYVDGQKADMEAYFIHGNNFVMLRDIGETVGFNVYWDGSAVQVESDKPYTGAAPGSTQPPIPAPPSGGYGPVTLIRQNPELPNGCEVTSLAMLLGAAGCPADKLELYWGYLPKADFFWVDDKCYGANPEQWYVGDAAKPTGGWYCFEGPVAQAANSWLGDRGSDLWACPLTGLAREELEQYAQAGTPLAVWVTRNYAAPRRSEFFWLLEDGTAYYPYRNLHCVVLAGVENGKYRIADPISGITLVEKELFWDSFSAMGGRAVIVGRGGWTPLIQGEKGAEKTEARHEIRVNWGTP